MWLYHLTSILPCWEIGQKLWLFSKSVQFFQYFVFFSIRKDLCDITCGCGPVLCMACMSPAVDSELYSKKAWYFYNGSKLEHHSSTLMKLQSGAMTVFFFTLLANWSCDHPPVISSAAIQYIPLLSICFNNFSVFSIFWDGPWTLSTATAMPSQERALPLFLAYFFVIL